MEDQYLLGDRLLVAPVMVAGATLRRIVLPEGTWHDFWGERIFTGPGTAEYPAPLDCLPILVRGGTVLPLGPPLTHIDDGHRFEELTLHCYPPYPAQGELYEDDGSTRAYQAGIYDLTALRVVEEDGALRVEITPVVTQFSPPEARRRLEIVLHRAFEPAVVLLDGQPHTAYTWDAANALVTITCEQTVAAPLVIAIAPVR